MKFNNAKFFLLIIAGFVFSQFSFAKSVDSVLMTVGNDTVYTSNFLYIYQKNNKKGSPNYQTIEQYLNLFVNFKLKVKAAEDLGMDTTASFKNELAGYRKQLAKPYLTSKKVTEKLIKQAYDRMKTQIKASHILISLPPDASPQDTAIAYKVIMKIRKRILNGANFNTVAAEVSQDPSAKENKGELGWFSAFQMVYPFESAAYNTPVGKVSMPVRTRFGYHIIKVEGRRPAQGKITVAHIYVGVPRNADKSEAIAAKKKIHEIYAKLKKGAKFSDLAKKYSDDKQTANNGGVLKPFSQRQRSPIFSKTAFSLKKDGDYSKPFQTKAGWEIIKRISLDSIGSFAQEKDELKEKVAHDSRSNVSKEAFINQLKNEYHFKGNLKRRNDFYKVVNDSLFNGKWNIKDAAKLNGTMFSFADKEFTQQQFAKYIASNQVAGRLGNVVNRINELYSQFVSKKLMDYESTQLPRKYPAFKRLLNEYKEGILLFDLTNKKVWSKAVKDTTGLKNFYKTESTKYMWPKRVDAKIFSSADKEMAQKVMKVAKKIDKQGYTDAAILKMFNTNVKAPQLKIDSGLFTKDSQPILSKVDWKKGLSSLIEIESKNNKTSYQFVYIKNIVNSKPKKLSEVRGMVIADYQQYLKKQWVQQLHKKYKVIINQKLLQKIEQQQ